MVVLLILPRILSICKWSIPHSSPEYARACEDYWSWWSSLTRILLGQRWTRSWTWLWIRRRTWIIIVSQRFHKSHGCIGRIKFIGFLCRIIKIKSSDEIASGLRPIISSMSSKAQHSLAIPLKPHSVIPCVVYVTLIFIYWKPAYLNLGRIPMYM